MTAINPYLNFNGNTEEAFNFYMLWGAYYGSFADKFGVQWMVNYDKNHQK